jgi:hypothetical protein
MVYNASFGLLTRPLVLIRFSSHRKSLSALRPAGNRLRVFLCSLMTSINTNMTARNTVTAKLKRPLEFDKIRIILPILDRASGIAQPQLYLSYFWGNKFPLASLI